LNKETDLEVKQALIDRISVLNDSLQKVENNILMVSHEYEYTHRGSPTSRSELSMMFHGLPHHDEHKDSLDIPHDSVITPVPYKVSQYKSDDSAFNKMTPFPSGPSESIDNTGRSHNFKTPTPLSSGLPPRKQFKVTESHGDSHSNSHSHSHNLQQFTSFHKTDEKADTPDNQHFVNSLGNSGMSLSEMFDACLNSIKRNANAVAQGGALNAGGKKDIFIPPFIQKSPVSTEKFQENLESTKLTEIPEAENEIRGDSGELPEGARSPGLSAHDEWKNLNIEEEKKLKDFIEKLEGVVVRKYFKRWRHVPSVFKFQKYQEDDEFDLLHGKFEGIEGADYLDDFSLKTGSIIPIEHKAPSPIKGFDHDNDNLLSERLSFYDMSENTPTAFNETEIEPKHERSSIVQEYLLHHNKENDDIVNKPSKISSPRASTTSNITHIIWKKQPGVSSKTKILKPGTGTKSPVKREPLRAPEKPKTGARSSSIKAAGKVPPTTNSVRTSTTNLKSASTKENNPVSKASPAKLKRTVSGASATSGKH